MKIAYLLNQYPYASCTFIRREIQGLEALGVEVDRISIRTPEMDLVDEADRSEAGRTRIILDAGATALAAALLHTLATRPAALLRTLGTCLRLGWRSQRGVVVHLAYLAEACVLLRWLAGAGAEHVHAHFGTNATSVAMLCRRLGGPPYSFTVHGPREFDAPEALHLGEKTRHASFVAVISSYTRAQLFRWCDAADWHKVHVVHCGVSDTFLAEPEAPPPAAPRLVCVGRLGEQKGIPLLVEAARRLAKEGVDFRLALVGDGELRGEVTRRIRAEGLEDRIELLGWMSDAEVRSQLLAARALVLPSFAEGLPVVVMEALALGRPVIATAIAGIPELVEAGRSGWIVPAGSAAALAGAMRAALVEGPERLAEMGARGRERVLRDHDAAAEAKRLARLLRGDAPADRD